MSNKINIIQGPPTSKVTKEAAEKQLIGHPQFPKGASYTLDEVEGRWVAAITVEAGPEAFQEEPTPEAPEAEGPPLDDETPDGPSSDDDGGSESDDSEKSDKGDDKKGEKGELEHLVKLVTTLLDALGINPDGGESPVPGPDDEQIPGPPGPDGPPSPHDGPPGGSEKQVVRHERSLKPGESAPGTTPIGAPAFSSVSDDHPWKEVIANGVRSFPVEEEIGDTKLSAVRDELNSLAEGTGYEVKQLREKNVNGRRVASALVSK